MCYVYISLKYYLMIIFILIIISTMSDHIKISGNVPIVSHPYRK